MPKKMEYVKDTIEQFVNCKDFISVDDLKLFAKSPRTYFYEKVINTKSIKLFSLGVAVYESFICEEVFKTKYIVAPKYDKRTKIGKESYTFFIEQESVGKIILTEDENNIIQQIRTNLLINQEFERKIMQSNYNCSSYVFDKKTEIGIKLRLDVFLENEYAIDFQSCKESSPIKFKSEVEYHKHFLNAAIYKDFLGIKEYIFVACESQAPFQVCLYALSDEMIVQGRKEYRMSLDLLKWSLDNNYWCNYTEFEILKSAYLDDKLGEVINTLQSVVAQPIIHLL